MPLSFPRIAQRQIDREQPVAGSSPAGIRTALSRPRRGYGLLDQVDWVRAKVSSVSPPPSPNHVRPQAQVGSVLLPLLDCIDSLQTPVGSMAPIPTVWLADRQCYHRSSVVRQ